MSEQIHPVQLEIYRNLFTSVAEEMGTVLKRTAYSPNIKERRDYSCAVFDGDGDLVAMGDHMPVHLGAMPLSVKAARDAFVLRPGDLVILNDPFSGGTHLPDITMILPVFGASSGNGKPLFLVAARAHHSDVGGMSPGSMPLSRDVFQEGVRIPPLKLYEGGRMNRSLLQLILCNVRTPLEREGDLAAQVAALRAGERRLTQMAAKNGEEQLRSAMESLQEYAEKIVGQLIQRIPEGRYEAEDFLDDDGAESRGSSGGEGIKIKVAIEVADGRMRIDFDGTDPQVEGCLNAVEAITLSAVNYVLRCLAPRDAPSSSGLMRAVEVVAPAGTLVNASYPAATAAGNVETSQRIVDVLLKALAEALPDRIPAASSGTMNNITLGGVDPLSGRPFSYYETIGGGMGGSPQGAGDNGVHTHMTNSLNTPVEALERYFPFRVREYRLRQGSGGRGKNNGGEGVVRCLEMLGDCEATILSERRGSSPYGLQGGRPGKKGANHLVVRGRRKRLPGKVSLKLSRGEMLCLETPGGGGWGSLR